MAGRTVQAVICLEAVWALEEGLWAIIQAGRCRDLTEWVIR